MTGIVTVLAVVVLAPVAGAADTKEIARDLADGRLDGAYSQADLSAYLQDAMVQGYGSPTAPPVSGVAGAQSPTSGPTSGDGAAGAPAAAGVAGEQSPTLGETAQVGTLPFTGIDLALLVFGGALLLLVGLGARRVGRQRA